MSADDGVKSPAEIERRERFVRVVERRMKRILKDLQLLGNCGNRRAYSYTEADVEHIFEAIERQLDVTRAQFGEKRKDVEFRL